MRRKCFDMRIASLLVFITMQTACISTLDLIILHTNDVHARFEQFDPYGNSCDDTESAEGKCFGGVARRVTKIRETQANEDNVVLLDGGDQFQGTVWFSLFKGSATSHFMNVIGYDVMVCMHDGFSVQP